jgi:hypothetical protein
LAMSFNVTRVSIPVPVRRSSAVAILDRSK